MSGPDDEANTDTTSFEYTVLQGPVAAFTEDTLTPFEGQIDRLDDVSTDDLACCARVGSLQVVNADGGVPSRLLGMGAVVTEFSSSSNTTSTTPNFAIDINAGGGVMW